MTKVLIIAEAGVNHNGSIELAKRLIDEASNAGVDYVKFQTFKASNLVSKKAQKAEYQINNTQNAKESQFDMVKKLELSEDDHHTLISHCKSRNIKFFSTAFDLESIDLLIKLGINLFKIPSGEITNLPFLEKIGSLNHPVILSTGMSTMEEIKAAVNVLVRNGTNKNKITILHCNTEYPTPMQDVNLRAMNNIKEEIGVNVGYSDHTLGIEVPIAAVALGAICIEKHFTLDRTMTGPDHRASLEPNELKAMVSAIRNIEFALQGSGQKELSISEKKNIVIARKSIHIAVPLKKGVEIQKHHLIMKRPGDGISPMEMNNIIGKKVLIDLDVEHKLKISDFI